MSKDKNGCGFGDLTEVNIRLINKIRTACLQQVGTLMAEFWHKHRRAGHTPLPVFLNLTANLYTGNISECF